MLQVISSPVSGVLRDHREVPYPFTTLWINGRTASIDKVVQEKENAQSPFEQSVFSFIKEWLSGQDTFQVYTSGSTGTPRAIAITRTQMLTSALRTAEKILLERESTALVCIDPKHIGGKMMLVRCLALGLRIMAVEPTGNPLIKVPVDKCVQFTAFVPYQVTSVLESKHPHLLNAPDKILIGGAPINPSAAGQLDRFQCACYETYGMTETVSHVALRLLNGPMKQAYFETLPGVEIGQDERGCLVITADYLPDPVITNDIVEIVNSGQFLWRGRWDTVINTGGVKVQPENVEKELAAIFHKHNFNNRFFIAGLPDEKLGSRVVLVLEGVQISSELLNRSLAALQSAVSAFEFPREVYSAPEFTLTQTQKIDRIKTLTGVSLLSSLK